MSDDDAKKTDDTAVSDDAAVADDAVMPSDDQAVPADDTAVEPTDDATDEDSAPVAEEPAEEASSEEPVATSTDAPVHVVAEPTGTTDQQGRPLYNVKCTNCGKDTQVPFEPAPDRPVYCRDCFMAMRSNQGK